MEEWNHVDIKQNNNLPCPNLLHYKQLFDIVMEKGFLLLRNNFSKVILLARVRLSCKHKNWERVVDFHTAEESMDAL